MMFKGPSSNTPNNGMLRCYNMVPDNFSDINEMTAYLETVAALGMNVVWINPIQMAGSTVFEKSDSITGQQQRVTRSLYAMAHTTFIDTRFSVVKHDKDGDIILTPSQAQTFPDVDFRKIVKQLKKSRAKIEELEETIEEQTSDLEKKKITAKRKKGIDAEFLADEIQSLEKELKENEAALAEQQQLYKSASLAQSRCVKQLDTAAIQAFTKRAKELGITPIFDLVLNHVSEDLPFYSNNKELFDPRDRTYPDAKTFAYSKLCGKFADDLTEQQKQELLAQIPVIVDQFWKPFINTYINQYGFSGARVDCVRKVPQELRQQVYDLIRAGVEAREDNTPCVILEETLFSDLSPQKFADKIKGAGATHNTGSVYYRQRQWHGGLSDDYNNEDYYKKQMVQQGVVNFSGNHDHYTCAMTVCRELAFERLQANKELYASYLEYVKAKEEAAREIREDNSLSDSVLEQIKSQYTHYYVKQIIAELNDPDNFNDNINRFGKAFRDKFLTNVFAGSGGFFMLSGDEYASLHQPSILLRENGERLYPQKHLVVFGSPFAEDAEAVVTEMAEALTLKRKYGTAYRAMSAENKVIFLSAIKEQLTNEINANVEQTHREFVAKLKAKLQKNFSKELLSAAPAPLTANNGWNRPLSLRKFTDPAFFQEANEILSKLPPSKTGFWSELFKAVNDDILIAVRVNGVGYDAEVDVVIQNINPHKTVRLDKTDLEKIGMWFQKRGFPNVEHASMPPNAEYHKAYGCIMGSSELNQLPAKLYFGGKIELDKDITDYKVKVHGIDEGFKIVVKPKPIEPDPLFAHGPEQYVPESLSARQLLTMFNGLGVQDKKQLSELLPEPNASVDLARNPKATLRRSSDSI